MDDNTLPPGQRSITLHSDIIECEKIFSFLNDFLVQNAIPESIHSDLKLIAEETFTNIVKHAGQQDADRQIIMEPGCDSHSVSITFTDSGQAFNPMQDYDADIKTGDYADGGMGIHIIRSLSDEMSYQRIQQHNVFTVTKHYTQQL